MLSTTVLLKHTATLLNLLYHPKNKYMKNRMVFANSVISTTFSYSAVVYKSYLHVLQTITESR